MSELVNYREEIPHDKREKSLQSHVSRCSAKYSEYSESPGRVKYNSRGGQCYVPLPPVPSTALQGSVGWRHHQPRRTRSAFPTQIALATPPFSPESPWQREGTVPEANQHLQQDGLTASWDRRDVKQQPGTGVWVRNH